MKFGLSKYGAIIKSLTVLDLTRFNMRNAESSMNIENENREKRERTRRVQQHVTFFITHKLHVIQFDRLSLRPPLRSARLPGDPIRS